MVNLQKNRHAAFMASTSKAGLKLFLENGLGDAEFRQAASERYSYLVKRNLRAFLHSV